MRERIDLAPILRESVTTDYFDLVTRPTGASVRGRLEARIAQSPHPTTQLDFGQIGLLDFSCADEVVAKLLLRTPDGRPRFVVLVNVSDSHLDAIEQVLETHQLTVMAVHASEPRPCMLGWRTPDLVTAFDAVNRLGAFFDIIHQDPILSQVKLIAEPWDVGPDGYQVGNFPVLWAEWNAEYRDTVRSFWKGDGGQVATLAYRLTGSSDLYEHSGRRPYASINFITAHDGFTLRDLVSYNDKHNAANGEDNRDGHDHNLSWNCGVEGETNDSTILAMRARQQRNFLATLLLSQGVPMLSGGDELCRTQLGNNNAFCQDNAISWTDWDLRDASRDLLAFTTELIRLQHEEPVLHRRTFFQGRAIRGSGIQDIAWLSARGHELSDRDWQSDLRCFAMLLPGDAIDETDARGRRIVGSTLFVMFNAGTDAVPFVLPHTPTACRWTRVFDTAHPTAEPAQFAGASDYTLEGRSVVVLRTPVPDVTTTPTHPSVEEHANA